MTELEPPISSNPSNRLFFWGRILFLALLLGGFLWWRHSTLAPAASTAPEASKSLNKIVENTIPPIVFATRQAEITPDTGKTYFVSPAGSDENDGMKKEAPLQTIQKALDLALPGDTVTLAPGIYRQDIVSRRNGTAEAPITLTGTSESIIKGGKSSRIIEINHDYLTLQGFAVDGLYGASDTKKGYRDKLIYVLGKEKKKGVTGLHLTHLTLKNAGGECVRLRYFATHNEIAENTISHCGFFDFMFHEGGKNGEGIYIGTAPEQRGDGTNPTTDPDESKNNWVHDNTIDTQGNECVDIKEGAAENVVEKNSCTGQKDKESGGMDARGNKNVFRSNLIFGNVGAGIRLGGDKKGDGIENFVSGNTLRNNQGGGIKIMRKPQSELCGNTFEKNGDSDFTGDEKDEGKKKNCP